jgi:hypothetical protein
MAMFYAQSWLLTHYMFRAEGMQPKLTAYLKAVAAGTCAYFFIMQKLSGVAPDGRILMAHIVML